MTLAAMAGFTALAVLSPTALAQQASLTLSDSGAKICYANNTSWTLTKTNDATGAVNTGTLVTWTVTATRGATGPNIICVVGFISITNTGSAPAPIGNIVVNLQKPTGLKNTPWVSAAADVADATSGDGATSAKIVPGASQENPTVNASLGTNNYTITNVAGCSLCAYGRFVETAASGALEFTDADTNTAFSLVPQVSIPVGATVNLLFTAKFNNTILNIPTGTLLRTEAIVSFGSAGGRGGSGATGTKIDINGNGTIDTNEANVRSVPTRLTTTLPPLQNCNDNVTLTDVTSTTPGAGFSSTQNDIGAGLSVSTSGAYTVAGTVTGTGTVTNTAFLKGTDTSVTVTGSAIDPLTGLPVRSFTFPCCVGVDLEAVSSVNVDLPSGFVTGQFCTYTKGGYAGPGAPGQIFNSLFTSVFFGGLTIGIDDGPNPLHDAKWTATATGQSRLKTYLTSPAGGASTALTADTTNATSTSGGQLPRQTAALTLNVGFSGVFGGTPFGFGSLKLCNTGTSLDGATISAILGAADNALAGNGLPSGFSFGDLNTLITNLNESFDNCQVGSFAANFLCQ